MCASSLLKYVSLAVYFPSLSWSLFKLFSVKHNLLSSLTIDQSPQQSHADSLPKRFDHVPFEIKI
jgi:hypothetical protein